MEPAPFEPPVPEPEPTPPALDEREMSAQNEGMAAAEPEVPAPEALPSEPPAKPKSTRARKPKKAVEE
jgi:hypothetical protein